MRTVELSPMRIFQQLLLLTYAYNSYHLSLSVQVASYEMLGQLLETSRLAQVPIGMNHKSTNDARATLLVQPPQGP